VTATIHPFPEPALRPPCADPAACLAVAEVQVGSVVTAVCPRCGRVGVLDATLDELDAAIEAQEVHEAPVNSTAFPGRQA